ncbi:MULTISPECIES: hypothetical protein [unclassified Clostridium]|uniref:hypothetical protein n=1 Tax=unclassified Clostridium TaxID=2614128 RepID=UPI00029750A0|nr:MULTISPECIES: hypothetical protein [unclassified Clostridium]EKQ51385.1 MAG: hypothetical protein A370_04912 [Clostridium sp. Maddingley MBC34-26]
METNFGIVIDEKGYKIAFIVLNSDNTPQGYILKNGENIVKNDWSKANAMKNPKWDGTTWIETATQEEIDAASGNVIKMENQDDLISKLILDNLNMQMQIDTLIQSNL